LTVSSTIFQAPPPADHEALQLEGSGPPIGRAHILEDLDFWTGAPAVPGLLGPKKRLRQSSHPAPDLRPRFPEPGPHPAPASSDITALPPRPPSGAMVFHSYAPIPSLSVARNLSWGWRSGERRCGHHRPRTRCRARACCSSGELRPKGGPPISPAAAARRVALLGPLCAPAGVRCSHETMSNLDAQLRESCAPSCARSFCGGGAPVVTSPMTSKESHGHRESHRRDSMPAACSSGHGLASLPPTRTLFVAQFHPVGPRSTLLKNRWQPAAVTAEHLPLLCGKVGRQVRVVSRGMAGRQAQQTAASTQPRTLRWFLRFGGPKHRAIGRAHRLGANNMEHRLRPAAGV